MIRAWNGTKLACVVMLALAFLSVAVIGHGLEDANPRQARVKKLIQLLGDSKFDVRTSAREELVQMGVTPLEELRGASKSPDPEVRRLADETLTRISRRMSKETRAVAMSSDARWALMGTTGPEGSIFWLIDLATGKEQTSFLGHDGRLGQGCFSRDGRRILTSGFGSSNIRPADVDAGKYGDCSIRLWDIETGKELKRLVGHTYLTATVAFSADEKRAISSGRDFTARAWSMVSGRETAVFKHPSSIVIDAIFSPDSRTALSASDERIYCWDPDTGRQLRTIEVANTMRLAFSPDGKTLAICVGKWVMAAGGGLAPAECMVRLVDWETGKELRVLRGHQDVVQCAAFSSDGKRVVSGARDHNVRLWEAASGKELASFKTKAESIGFVRINENVKRISCLSFDGVFEQFDMPP